MVDVKKDSLGSLVKNSAAHRTRFSNHLPSRLCEREDFGSDLPEFADQALLVHRWSVQTFPQRVVMPQKPTYSRARGSLVAEVRQTHGSPADLVFISRSDSAAGGADLCAAG